MSDQSKKKNDETQGGRKPGKRLEEKAKPVLTPEQIQKRKEKRIMIVMIVLAVVMVIVTALVLLYRRWVQKPNLPPEPGQTHQVTGSDDPGADPSADPSAEPTLDFDAIQPKVGGERKSKDIYTFLIFGTDIASGLTDTMMLATYDITNQKATVMSLPRDTLINVRWSNKCLNTVYSAYSGGQQGVEALKNEVSELVGFVPDFYVKIDWELVGEMVDAIGGVWFDNPYHMEYYDPYQDLLIYQEQGYRKLSGSDAMQVVRWRHNNKGVSTGSKEGDGASDLIRLKLQHDFLKAVLKQTLQIKNVFRIGQLAELFGNRVDSDLLVENIFWFAQEAIMGGLQVEDVNFCTMPIFGVYQGVYKNRVYPDQSELLKLINESLNPFVEQVTLRQLDLIRVSADGDTLSSSTGRLADPSAAIPPVRETDPPEESDPLESGEPTESGEPQESEALESGQPGESEPPATEPPFPVGDGPADGDWGDTPD